LLRLDEQLYLQLYIITKRSAHRVQRKYRSRADQKIVSLALRLNLE